MRISADFHCKATRAVATCFLRRSPVREHHRGGPRTLRFRNKHTVVFGWGLFFVITQELQRSSTTASTIIEKEGIDMCDLRWLNSVICCSFGCEE